MTLIKEVYLGKGENVCSFPIFYLFQGLRILPSEVFKRCSEFERNLIGTN